MQIEVKKVSRELRFGDVPRGALFVFSNAVHNAVHNSCNLRDEVMVKVSMDLSESGTLAVRLSTGVIVDAPPSSRCIVVDGSLFVELAD